MHKQWEPSGQVWGRRWRCNIDAHSPLEWASEDLFKERSRKRGGTSFSFVARSSWTRWLWGDRHPNAHKERLKTTSRMHIEVRKASVGFFLRSFPAPLPSLRCCPLHTRVQTPFVINVHLCFLQMECSRLPACVWVHFCHFSYCNQL